MFAEVGKRYTSLVVHVAVKLTYDLQSGGGRYGDLSLRQQRITQRMLNTLMVQPLRIELSLWTCGSDTEEPEALTADNGVFSAPLNEFVLLRGRISNMSCAYQSSSSTSLSF